jgi:HEAT repeat protein
VGRGCSQPLHDEFAKRAQFPDELARLACNDDALVRTSAAKALSHLSHHALIHDALVHGKVAERVNTSARTQRALSLWSLSRT